MTDAELRARIYCHAIAFSRSASRTAAFVSCSPVAVARAASDWESGS